MNIALGDHQVTNFQSDVEARTIGARTHTPILDPGRWPDVRHPLERPADRELPVRRLGGDLRRHRPGAPEPEPTPDRRSGCRRRPSPTRRTARRGPARRAAGCAARPAADLRLPPPDRRGDQRLRREPLLLRRLHRALSPGQGESIARSDEPQPVGNPGVDARAAEAAGEEARSSPRRSGAGRPACLRPAGRRCRPRTRWYWNGSRLWIRRMRLPSDADHRGLHEAPRLAVGPVATRGPEDALLGRLQPPGDVEAPGAPGAAAAGADDPAGPGRRLRLRLASAVRSARPGRARQRQHGEVVLRPCGRCRPGRSIRRSP